MTGNQRHAYTRLIGLFFLLAGLLFWPAPALWAQSADAPPAKGPATPVEKSPSDAKPKTGTPKKTGEAPPKREQSYRRQKDNLKRFAPSEEIRVDKAVDFPADI